MYAYEAFNDGRMSDYIPTDEELKAGFDGIPQIKSFHDRIFLIFWKIDTIFEL